MSNEKIQEDTFAVEVDETKATPEQRERMNFLVGEFDRFLNYHNVSVDELTALCANTLHAVMRFNEEENQKDGA